MIKSLFVLLCLIGFIPFSNGQLATMKTTSGDHVEISTQKGYLVVENKALTSVTVELWKKNKLIKSVYLAPPILFTDQDRFFKKGTDNYKKKIFFNARQNNLNDYYFRLIYDKTAYQGDVKAIKYAIQREQFFKFTKPYKNGIIRLLGGGNVLFFKSLVEELLSNKSREKKLEGAAITFAKKIISSLPKSILAKVAVAGVLDIYTSKDPSSVDSNINMFTHYCIKKLLLESEAEYPLKHLNLSFYPHHSVNLDLGIQLRSDLLRFNGNKYSLSKEGSPKATSPFLGGPITPLYAGIRGRFLSRQKTDTDIRFSLVYGGYYEQSPIYFSTVGTDNLPVGQGVSNQKFGLELGVGTRFVGADNLMGLEFQVSRGLTLNRLATVQYTGDQPDKNITIVKFDETFNGLEWKIRMIGDLGLVSIAFEYGLEAALSKQRSKFGTRNMRLMVGFPLYRGLRVK